MDEGAEFCVQLRVEIDVYKTGGVTLESELALPSAFVAVITTPYPVSELPKVHVLVEPGLTGTSQLVAVSVPDPVVLVAKAEYETTGPPVVGSVKVAVLPEVVGVPGGPGGSCPVPTVRSI